MLNTNILKLHAIIWKLFKAKLRKKQLQNCSWWQPYLYLDPISRQGGRIYKRGLVQNHWFKEPGDFQARIDSNSVETIGNKKTKSRELPHCLIPNHSTVDAFKSFDSLISIDWQMMPPSCQFTGPAIWRQNAQSIGALIAILHSLTCISSDNCYKH